MRTLGDALGRATSPERRSAAAQLGATLASELRAHGVDFSFAPVLDLDHGASAVIGDRAFHRNPNAVAHLASALATTDSRAGGMAAVGKHFPGHGFVAADSHTEVPVDLRTLAEIVADDLVPFGVLVGHGLDGRHAGARDLSARSIASRRATRAPGCRRSCAGASASTA